MNQAQNDLIERRLALQTLDQGNQERLLAAEINLSNARLIQAQAAEKIATLNAGNPATRGISTVNLSIGLGGLVVSPNVESDMQRIADAAQSGLLAALNSASSRTTPRLDQNVAAAR